MCALNPTPNPANPDSALHEKALSHVQGAGALGTLSFSAWCRVCIVGAPRGLRWAAGTCLEVQLGCGIALGAGTGLWEHSQDCNWVVPRLWEHAQGCERDAVEARASS